MCNAQSKRYIRKILPPIFPPIFRSNPARESRSSRAVRNEICIWFRGLVVMPPDPVAFSQPSPAAFQPASTREAIFAGAPSCRASLCSLKICNSAPSLPSRRFPLHPGVIGRPPSALTACALPCSVLVGLPPVSSLWLLWAVPRVRRSSPLAKIVC